MLRDHKGTSKVNFSRFPYKINASFALTYSPRILRTDGSVRKRAKCSLQHKFELFLKRVPVLTVENRVENFLYDAERALVTDRGKILVADTVVDRKAHTDQGNVLIAGNIFRITVAEDKIR